MLRENDHAKDLERLLEPLLYERAWRYCLSLCRRTEEAQDLLQDALAQAMLRLPSLRDEQRFGPWLLSIVRSRFIDLRRRRRISEALEPGMLLAQAPQGDTQIDDPALLAALLSMPPRQREALELCYLHGLNLDEAAIVLRVSAAAAKQLLYRARTALRERLGRGPKMVQVALEEGRE
jgi:RNA polymerase sigma-70 factor (ECF subfamily)